ncbi:MAG TPA: hypothetical protein VHY09_10270, partial [Candidatus Methylacidiphilales bacterium]|nr:hypothetical protein [Candidatus Methylacidiphilales bacterium]
MDLASLEARIAALDQRLRPIAKRPVDISNPNWMEKLKARVPAVDEAGIRPEAEGLLADLAASYEAGDDQIREAIRQLFKKYDSFEWAVLPAVASTAEENFRRRLVHFSMCDQGRDSRDALLALQHICKQARAADVVTDSHLRRIAALSSEEDR